MGSPDKLSSLFCFSSPKRRRASMSRLSIPPVPCEPSVSSRHRRNSQSGSSYSSTHTIREVLPPLEIVKRKDLETALTPKSTRRSFSLATLAHFSPKRRSQSSSSLYESSHSSTDRRSNLHGSSFTEPSSSTYRAISSWSSHSTLSRSKESTLCKKSSSYHNPLSVRPSLNTLSPISQKRESIVRSSDSNLTGVYVADTDSVCSFAEEEVVIPSILTEFEAHKLVQQIDGTLRTQRNREEELNDHIEEETTLAKARYLHGNETGAVLAMKKVNKLSQERVRVTIARDVASEALADIQAAMKRAKTNAIRRKGIEEAYSYEINIGEDNARILLEIQDILDGSLEVITDKKQLLQQVKEL